MASQRKGFFIFIFIFLRALFFMDEVGAGTVREVVCDKKNSDARIVIKEEGNPFATEYTVQLLIGTGEYIQSDIDKKLILLLYHCASWADSERYSSATTGSSIGNAFCALKNSNVNGHLEEHIRSLTGRRQCHDLFATKDNLQRVNIQYWRIIDTEERLAELVKEQGYDEAAEMLRPILKARKEELLETSNGLSDRLAIAERDFQNFMREYTPVEGIKTLGFN